MNDTENEKQKYSVGARTFFALFGSTCLLAFIHEVFRAFTEDKNNLLLAAFCAGFTGYLYTYTALKGKAPSWFEDKSILNSNMKEHEPK